jgi:UDP-N-acetylglucosamine acyltransferase
MLTLIHPTAVIHPGAQLHPTVQVGAYAVIGPRVTIGAGTTVGPHAVIEGWTEIGERNRFFPGAAIGLEPQDLKYEGAETLVKIGNDNCFREYTTVHRATAEGEVTLIGNHNLLMVNAHVGHNCTLENHTIITNAVALAGHVHVESHARIGGVVAVHQFVRVGSYSMTAGFSRIIRDIPPFMLMEGAPLRVRSLNLVGLKRAGFAELNGGQTLKSLRQAFRLIYRSGLRLDDALAQFATLPPSAHLDHLHEFLSASQQKGRRGPTPGKRRRRFDDDED